MILSVFLWVAIIATIITLSHGHGRRYARRRHAGMSVWASVRVPGLPARVGVSKRL